MQPNPFYFLEKCPYFTDKEDRDNEWCKETEYYFEHELALGAVDSYKYHLSIVIDHKNFAIKWKYILDHKHRFKIAETENLEAAPAWFRKLALETKELAAEAFGTPYPFLPGSKSVRVKLRSFSEMLEADKARFEEMKRDIHRPFDYEKNKAERLDKAFRFLLHMTAFSPLDWEEEQYPFADMLAALRSRAKEKRPMSEHFAAQAERSPISWKEDEHLAIFYAVAVGWDEISLLKLKEKHNWSESFVRDFGVKRKAFYD